MITHVIFEVRSSPKIFDSIGVRIVLQSQPPQKYFSSHIGGLGGSGPHIINLPSSNFIGGSESVKIMGFRGVLCIWQLVFASCHRLISKNKNMKKNKNKMPKGCLMVMADPLDLGQGKNKRQPRVS